MSSVIAGNVKAAITPIIPSVIKISASVKPLLHKKNNLINNINTSFVNYSIIC